MIIGVTGPIASGKSEVGKILKKLGFPKISLSNFVRDEAKKRGLEIERKVLQDLGNELREKYGVGVLAEMALKKMECEDYWVVEGIRNKGEVSVFRKKDFILIGVDASKDIRFNRVVGRRKDSDPREWSKFLEIEARDRKEGGSGQDVDGCMWLADVIVENNGVTKEDLDEFHKKIISIIQKNL